jgi:hypothetical protein
MPLSGDFQRLGQLGRNLETLVRVPSRVAGAVAPRIARAIDREFTTGRDPYGRPWAPLRPSTIAKGRKPPPLTHTREMRDGLSVKPMPAAGIAITFAKEIPAIFHQKGTRYMARREILPTNVLPREWNQILGEESRRAFGGGR